MSQCAYSFDGLEWTDLPVGPQFNPILGLEEHNLEFQTDGGIQWLDRLFQRDSWDLTFKCTFAQLADFRALHDAAEGQLLPFFITLDRTADQIVAIYGNKEQGFMPRGTGEAVMPPVFIYNLKILGVAMAILTYIPSYAFAGLPAAPTAGSLARVSDAPGGLWMFSGVQWVQVEGCINVKNAPYNAAGDGSTADTAAFAAACAVPGSRVYVPAGDYRLGNFDIASNVTLFGDGYGISNLKTIDSAGVSYMLRVPNTSTGVRIRDLTIDGNRANGGMLDGLSAPCQIKGSSVTIEDCEIKYGTRYGVFIGDDSVLSHEVTLSKCYIHDNGGVVDDTGYGCGIGSGGTVTPEDVSIVDCTIKSNYNTVTKPGDSSAINLEVKGVKILGLRAIDNFNVAGGQVVINGSVDQTSDIDAVISGYHIENTTTFGTPKDRTCGIEIQGRNFAIGAGFISLRTDNALGISGIQIGGDASHASGYGTIAGAIIDLNSDVSTGIDLDPAGVSSGITNVTVIGCVVKNGTIGINTNAVVHSIAQGNDFTSCTQPQAGTVTSTMLMQGNLPYGVANSANGRTHMDAVSAASANNLTLGNSNINQITGTTQINLIDSTGWYVGDVVKLYFTASLTVKDGQASSGNFKKILLSGGADFSATDKDVLTLLWNGTEWAQQSAANNA